MARDADALKIEKWAAAGDVQDPEERDLDRSVGWPADYSQPGGRQPSREVFNQLLRELSALGVEVNVHGAFLEWDSSISYIHPAVVTGSDNKLYQSVGSSQGEDPVTDVTNASWTPIKMQGRSGRIDLENAVRVQTGADEATQPYLDLTQDFVRLPHHTSDPTGTGGEIIYRSDTGQVRVNEGGTWRDMVARNIRSGTGAPTQAIIDASVEGDIYLQR